MRLPLWSMRAAMLFSWLQPCARRRVAGLLLVCLASLAGCSSDSALEPLAADATILAFGDSLTEGKGVSRSKSYPSVLAELTGLTVINAGISGEVSADGLSRLPGVLAETQPQLVILMHGGNDILQNRSQQELKSNLQGMIAISQEAGASVVLVGIPEKKIFSSTAPLYRELAEDLSLVFESDIISSLLKKPSMKSDSVHFNASGYRAIAERLQQLLADNGGL